MEKRVSSQVLVWCFGGHWLLLMVLIALFGGYSPGTLSLHGAGDVKYGLFWGACFLIAGAFEDLSFRGYMQVTLAPGLGFWPAAVLLSIGFCAFHLWNPGETWAGITMLFCFGMLAAFTLWRTGDLWFIIGLHAAWDWAHVFLFSVPIAGLRATGHLSHSSLHGPQWLTGGTAGPDGSLFAFVVLVLIAALVQRIFSDRKGGLQTQAGSTQTEMAGTGRR
jgi:CAAX protease family protein